MEFILTFACKENPSTYEQRSPAKGTQRDSPLLPKHSTLLQGIYLHVVLEKQSAIMSDLNVNVYWSILVFSTFIVTGPNSD